MCCFLFSILNVSTCVYVCIYLSVSISSSLSFLPVSVSVFRSINCLLSAFHSHSTFLSLNQNAHTQYTAGEVGQLRLFVVGRRLWWYNQTNVETSNVLNQTSFAFNVIFCLLAVETFVTVKTMCNAKYTSTSISFCSKDRTSVLVQLIFKVCCPEEALRNSDKLRH